MANRFVGTLQIQTQEQKQIILMLCTGFFMGVFIATYQVTADSLFLNRLGNQLDRAFLIAGVLGIATTTLFSTAQSFIKFTTLALSSVALIFAFTLGAYWLIHFGNPEYQDYYIFALYCMSGPITAALETRQRNRNVPANPATERCRSREYRIPQPPASTP